MSITDLSLIESLLWGDRPLAWWGLDTADPTADDAVYLQTPNGYTLTVNGTPANADSLHTRGDAGASGCRDFDGTDDAYWTPGTVTETATGPPQLHATAEDHRDSTTATVLVPGGVAVGDLLIFVSTNQLQTATVTTPPDGFALVGTVLNCGTHSKAVYSKVAVEADTRPAEVSITWSVSNHLASLLLVIRNCDPDVANLIYDSGEVATSSGTNHSTTTETFPEQSWSLVIWTSEYTEVGAEVPDVFPTGAKQWALVEDPDLTNDLKVLAVAYHNETAGSRALTATTTAATRLGSTHITFGAPERVTNDSLDTLNYPATFHALINADSFATNDRMFLGINAKCGVYVTTAGVLSFRYHDGTAFRTHAGPTLTTGTTYRIWVRDDGTDITFTVNGSHTTVSRFNDLDYQTDAAGHRVTIGSSWDGMNFTLDWDGRIDEPAIFDAALSDDMIAAHEEAATLGTFGQYLQGLTPRYPRAKLELALTSNPTDRCPVYSDVTDDVRSPPGLQITYGRNSELDRMQAGRMDFVLSDRDRIYTDLTPTRTVRFRVQTATDEPVVSRFFGYTDGPRLLRPASGFDATVAITATDLFKALAVDKVRETLVRPTEMPGVRIQSVLADVSGLRYLIDDGSHLVVGADIQGNGRLEHAQAVAETDGGIVFASPDGVLIFHGSQYRSLNSSEVEAIFGWVEDEA